MTDYVDLAIKYGGYTCLLYTSVIESLGRIKQFNYQTEDVINLLKTGLYSDLTQAEVDAFEQYLGFAEVKGATKFHKP